MLEEDVQANKSMGQYGADALFTAAKARGRAANGKLRVLTHCNTGSLATAAYGTALGVVRSLHETGRLEHAYCTETRPYNQGARLTAYELVMDGLPSTLVCDSAVAALMSQGHVDAVVVGADRIAANGDTANKIGTCNVAIVAAYHDIPFFTAAPTTTLDPELDDGSLIPIEERSPEEITHFKGQRVAAEINVWNPSFDVTPCALLEGIITEKGLVPRSGSTGAFSVRSWLEDLKKDGQLPSFPAAAYSSSQQSPGSASGFVALHVDTIREYIAARPHLSTHVGEPSTSSTWTVEEVGDGNINFVYIVRGPLGDLCVKQALPYVRCVGEEWPLTQDRVRIEAAALQVEARHCPQHVPALHEADAPMCLIAMQYVPPPHIILRKGLIQGEIYPLLADHVSSLLAQTLFHTSLFALSSPSFREQVQTFHNPEMCALTEQVIFTDPYFSAKFNRHTAHPSMDAVVSALQGDIEARAAATALKEIFMEKAEALLHGDLHTGSLMVTQDSTFAIDPEFAFVGPMAFDIAKVIANLLLAYFASDGHEKMQGSPRSEQKAWLLQCVMDVWNRFHDKFLALWEEKGTSGDLYARELYGNDAVEGKNARKLVQNSFFDQLWREVIGFSGAVIIRRLVGIAHVADFEEISDVEERAACEVRALKFGRELLVDGGQECKNVTLLVKKAARD